MYPDWQEETYYPTLLFSLLLYLALGSEGT
jgi:hypothetical protein